MKNALIVTAVGGLLAATSAHANLVVNGDFETGTPSFPQSNNTPWSNPNYFPPFAGINNVSIVAGNAHSGTYAAALTEEIIGGTVAGAVLQQVISLVAGETTIVDFWAKTTGTGNLTVMLNGVNVTPGNGAAMTITGATGYTEYSYSVTPASATGVLSFGWDQASANPATTLYLDDVSITQIAAVPEPASVIAGGLMLLPFGAGILQRLRKSRA